MNIIRDSIGSGKTKRLIQKSNETGAVIVVASYFKAMRLRDKAEAYGIAIPDPICWTDAIKAAPGGTYLIDDLDEVLEVMFNGRVDTVVVSDENTIV